MKRVGYILTILVPVADIHAASVQWIDDLVSGSESVIGNFIIPTLSVLATTLFLWGCVQFIMSAGDEKVRGEGKQKMMWGIVGLFVLVTVWGLVAMLTQVVGVTPVTNVSAPGFNV